VKSSHSREEIAWLPAEIKPVIVIGRFHARPSNNEWDADVSKEEIGKKSDETDPDQKLRRKGREKELADSFLHFCIIRPEHPI
jgi:hypothetical protein